uniref:Uncharacterized protein n=1 Tax=Tanacetum cinerariifolium TaxID=118510 RepID=A0A699UUI2_TANCI|nr:hypothetical protein [Tanacetum cinerariifolium]
MEIHCLNRPGPSRARHSDQWVLFISKLNSHDVSASKSEAVLNPYPYAAMDKAPAQQLPTHGTSVSRQGIPRNSLFKHMSGQDPNGWVNTEQIQQLNSNHQTE